MRICFTDQAVAGGGIPQVAFPAFHGGFDEGRHRRRTFADGVGHTDNRVAVGRVAPVAERIDIERLPAFGDGERLGGHVALLHQVFIGEERLNVKGIGAHFAASQTQLAFRPRPEGGIGLGGEQEGFVFKFRRVLHLVMGDKHRRRVLEHGGDGHRVHPGLPGLQRLAVVAKGAVRLTGRHQLHDVDLRAAHFNFDI